MILNRLFTIGLLLVVVAICIQCSMGIKRVGNYRTIKKEISKVTCIVHVNFFKVKDDRTKPPMLWERVPSEQADSLAMSIIRKFVHGYSRKRFLITHDSFTFDSSGYFQINRMFNQLDRFEQIEDYTILDATIRTFEPLDDRYLLLIWQNGYHFSHRYLNTVEGKEAAQFLLSAASMGTAVAAGGVGFAHLTMHDKGYVETAMAFIDKVDRKVLYYSQRASHDNPFADSTIIDQLSSMFARF